MVACFGLHDGYQLARIPGDRLVERVPRLDVFWLHRMGALVQGTTTEIEIDSMGDPRPVHTLRIRREIPGITINGMLVRLTWDEAFRRERPWFECPICSQRCRHVFLRDQIGCRRCHRLDYAVRHVNRQMPSAARAVRFRRRLGCGDLRPFAPLPPRRRGRRRARYEQLVAQIHAEEERLVACLASINYDLHRRLRGRRGPKRHDRTKAPRSDPASS